MERDIAAGNSAILRCLLSEGKSLQAATLEAALRAWEQRLQKVLPSLSYAVRSARAASAGTGSGIGNSKAGGGKASESRGNDSDGSKGSVGSLAVGVSGSHCQVLPFIALHREVASSALGCANPQCTGKAACLAKDVQLSICAGCKAVRYCR